MSIKIKSNHEKRTQKNTSKIIYETFISSSFILFPHPDQNLESQNWYLSQNVKKWETFSIHVKI